MAQRNARNSVKLQITIDAKIDEMLSDLIDSGIFGNNKAEVAVDIIKKWIWDNKDKLNDGLTRLDASPATATQPHARP